MNQKLRSAFIVCTLLFGLAACSEEDGISSSGGGSTVSDGGSGSAQFAGTYKGSMKVAYKGDGVDGNDTLATTIVIRTNGTVTMAIDGETVNGVINGNKVEIAFTVTESEDGITCKGNAVVVATVSGSSLSGPVTGDAECKLLLLERNADLTGTLTATKT
jgi:hypothetical protein